MAKVDLFQSPKQGGFLFYNLDAPVGRHGANRRDDVLLVQYLMKTSSNVPGKFSAIIGGHVTQVPGAWTNFDDMLLEMLQRNWAEMGTSTWQDGRVDPVPAGRTMTPVHQTQYKILTLNLIYNFVRPNDFPRMAEVADCPADLRQRIKAPPWISA